MQNKGIVNSVTCDRDKAEDENRKKANQITIKILQITLDREFQQNNGSINSCLELELKQENTG